MKRICAWCNKVLDAGKGEDAPISHGICPGCSEFVMANMDGQPLDTFLNGLNAPVMTVDTEGRISHANHKARDILGKDLAEMKGFLGGDVMECAYARLPGGCGQTIHCKACTIRITVNKSHTTGESFNQIPAYQNISSDGDVKKVRFLISTEKVADFVLLRIDDIKEMA